MAEIGIDAHAIGGRLTGNETYVTNLIDGLIGLDSGHRFTLLFTDERAAEEAGGRFPEARPVMALPANPLVRIPFVTPWLVWKLGLDLLHVQYVGPPVMTAPLVTVIHDISFETYPRFFSARERLQFRATFPLSARLAARVLTISEHSKRDLVEIYGLPEEKVTVTYLAAGDDFAPVEDRDRLESVRSRYGVGGPYVLAVGNLQPRKNIPRLIRAYSRMRSVRPDIRHRLVLVGKKAWRHDPVLSLIEESRWSDDIVLTGYVHLPALYSGADVFVYPSIYEGFGLPPLEAMACGTPVVVSDRASLPEVVGDAGVKVDPFDVDGIAAATASLLLEPAVNAAFSRAGLERARCFSWRECARRTLAVYEDVLREAGAS
jgi:glycosyltransferase involved in cell wall biosynthesis